MIEASRVPVAGPWVTDLEVEYVADAARNAWYEGAGNWVERFERSFAQAVGRSHAISLPSCTSGLHLALLAAGVGPGDEVVVPDATWIASAAPVSYVGATTTFADMDPATWCISPSTVERVLSSRTRAVIAVDLYGSMPDLEGLEELCRDRDLVLIEDAAEAIGGAIGDRRAGAFGSASAFSFHGSKTLTTGEGGMVVTDDARLHDRMRILRDHGRAVGDTTFSNDEVGYKYKMSDLQAAFGTAQLERLDELIERRQALFQWYEARLHDVPGLTLNPQPPGTTSGYWMVTVVLDGRLGWGKEQLRAALAREQIDSRPFFSPLSSLCAYAGSPSAIEAADRNVESYRVCPYGVNLPSALRLDEGTVDHVCRTLRRILEVPA